MFTLSKKICAAALGLALLFAVTTSANAQSFGGRMSTGEKAAYIGGGAAAGAIIGGLLGGKKGAIIGGLLGAGGGTGYVYYKGRDDDRYRRYYGVRDYRYQRSYDWRFDTDRRFDNDRRDDRRFREWDRWHRFNR
jgi:hypothetical protein